MTINEIKNKLKETGYIPTDDICYAVFGMLALNKPLLVEGAPGVGKTSLAKALAEVMGLPMLRLQMYDGLTKDEVLYDYDYQRQLLTLEAVKPKLNEEIKDLGINDAIKHVAGDVDFYGKEFLIPRPVLQTIDGSGRKLLLIDEIDKASEETEYMLYEYLEDYSIDIPQFGTVSCPEDQKPVVILTSNAYRELSGAMKRRCSYLYIKKKTRAEIIEVLKYRTSVDERVASGIASCMVAFQEMDLKHPVSVSEMKEVFPGGCSTYAFTNKLYDISEFMEMDDAAAAVSEVLKAIPRSGAYSNYELPFRTFYKSNMSKVTGDSYVYIIGDARNNKNRSGEEYVKAIARKAKKAFWLNTEEMSDWNTGDSIIGTYAKYMTKVAQTTTAAELLGFLES